jgi:hypothetical protein
MKKKSALISAPEIKGSNKDVETHHIQMKEKFRTMHFGGRELFTALWNEFMYHRARVNEDSYHTTL